MKQGESDGWKRWRGGKEVKRGRRRRAKVLDTVGCCARVPESTKTAFTVVFIISSFIYSSS